METAFLLSVVLLLLFGVLAFFDGVYLHLLKYRLHAITESKFEHITHTLRAFLFVGIVYTLYMNLQNNDLFYFGLAFVILDLIVLFADAFVEKDSRKFMGGLPRWEYIIHLFVNGFHFAGIALLLAIKINITEIGITLNNHFGNFKNYFTMIEVGKIILPGAILIVIFHVLVMLPKVDYLIVKSVSKIRNRFACCQII